MVDLGPAKRSLAIYTSAAEIESRRQRYQLATLKAEAERLQYNWKVGGLGMSKEFNHVIREFWSWKGTVNF